MKCVEFKGQTRLLGPPKGYNETHDAQCTVLPVREVRVDNMLHRLSVWKPTPEELLQLAAGAHVVLTVVGSSHPPVCLHVEAVEELP